MAANSKDKSKDISVETATVNPVTTNPVPASGRKVRVKFDALVCADWGTFYPRSVAEIPEARANELINAKAASLAEAK